MMIAEFPDPLAPSCSRAPLDIGMRIPSLDRERIWTIAGTCECGTFISGEEVAWVSRVSVYCYHCA